MKELWLNFKDEKGEPKRVLVEGEKFAIGRTPDNDLQIPLGNLSRQHAKIERFADVYIVTDSGSSNGTTLNGEPLENPVALKNDDILNLGEAVEIKIEFPSEKGKADDKGASPQPKSDDGDGASASSAGASGGSTASAKAATESAFGGSSGSLWLLLLAPIFMVLVLLGLGGAILVARSSKDQPPKNTDFIASKEDDEDFSSGDEKKTPEKETPTPTAAPSSSPGGTMPSETSTPTNSGVSPTVESSEKPPSTPTKNSTETEKIKFASAGFLRQIAGNDRKTFLLDKQIAAMNGKLNQFKGSGALAENIRNAKRNAAQIKSLAESKSLKPQFLAVAALTKLGNQKGDVVATATSMLENLSAIAKGFGSESADECLLVIAAYSNNTSGDSLQTTAGTFTTKGNNAGAARSIWFFKDNGKLTNEQFDFALQFLAIGTITQNPKDFNVSTEALVF